MMNLLVVMTCVPRPPNATLAVNLMCLFGALSQPTHSFTHLDRNNPRYLFKEVMTYVLSRITAQSSLVCFESYSKSTFDV